MQCKNYLWLILYATSRKGQKATAEPDSVLWKTTCDEVLEVKGTSLGFARFSVEFGSAERACRVLGEPGVSAFHMEGVVATGNQSCGLVGGDVVETDGAFGAHEKVGSDGVPYKPYARDEKDVYDKAGQEQRRKRQKHQKEGAQHVNLLRFG
ncbi:hypothetical protein V8G54_032379 [Vigna mungo]|uniref:Uncharacterized protein n=1 Tax=Vigna mungo TaxID=3915 RepID=A0AAQ3MLT6_VIGMU